MLGKIRYGNVKALDAGRVVILVETLFGPSPPLLRYYFPVPDLDWIRKLCLSFADVSEDMPWEGDLCFKVRGRIFTGVGLSDGRFPRVTLKCSSETIHERLEIEGIVRAPYVGRYDWIQLANSNVLPANELESLIRQSYKLVAAKAPKKRISKTPGKKVSLKKSLPKHRRARGK